MLIHRFKVPGLLSFGPQGIDLPMEPPNVLIGPNGSGKSNFLEAVAIKCRRFTLSGLSN